MYGKHSKETKIDNTVPQRDDGKLENTSIDYQYNE